MSRKWPEIECSRSVRGTVRLSVPSGLPSQLLSGRNSFELWDCKGVGMGERKGYERHIDIITRVVWHPYRQTYRQRRGCDTRETPISGIDRKETLITGRVMEPQFGLCGNNLFTYSVTYSNVSIVHLLPNLGSIELGFVKLPQIRLRKHTKRPTNTWKLQK